MTALVAATQTASAGGIWMPNTAQLNGLAHNGSTLNGSKVNGSKVNGVEQTVPTGATLLAVELPPTSH